MPARGSSPSVAIYSTFLQRAYDQLIHDVALQNLPVVFALDRAGLVGSDGATHQGSYDISFLRCIPNMVLMAPADENECRQMLYTGTTLSVPLCGPLSARHGSRRSDRRRDDGSPRGQGTDAARRPQRVGNHGLRYAARIGTQDRGAAGCHAREYAFRKPLDEALIVSVAGRHDAIVTIEENAVMGGAGSAVGEVLAAAGVQIPLLQLGIPDRFIEHGSRDTCLAAAGLDLAGLSAASIAGGHRRSRPESGPHRAPDTALA